MEEVISVLMMGSWELTTPFCIANGFIVQERCIRLDQHICFY